MSSDYRERIGKNLDPWLPLTSKDLDLFGTLALLQGMKERFGGEYRLSGPRSPVVSQLVVKHAGVDRQIDALREVYGLRRPNLETEAEILEIHIGEELHTVRVLTIMPLFQANVANLASLDQTDRNDLKHLLLMILVIREYFSEYFEALKMEAAHSRPVIIELELARKIISSSDALKCTNSHGIDFSRIWPRELLTSAKDSRLQNFVKHRLPLLA